MVTRNCEGLEVLLYLQTNTFAVVNEYWEKSREQTQVFFFFFLYLHFPEGAQAQTCLLSLVV